jgi:transcriptional regulator with XRE-family HTH domain
VTPPQAFGPNLRRLRVQRGISLEQLAARTNVSVELWEAMERNDFSRWPTGVAARAYIRDYAAIIGLDRDETVDEFCRITPNGDRRGYRLLRETAAVLGHELVWRDDLPPEADGDRRAIAPPEQPEVGAWFYRNLRRLVAALDLIAVLGLAAGITSLLRINGWATLAVITLLYYNLSVLFLGCSPAVWAIDAHFSAHRPIERPRVIAMFRGWGLMAGKDASPGRRATD